MYRVIEYFTDLQDDDHEYRTGDIFPREGLKVSEARLAELASAENLRGIPLIELVEPEKAGKGKSKNKAALTDSSVYDLHDLCPRIHHRSHFLHLCDLVCSIVSGFRIIFARQDPLEENWCIISHRNFTFPFLASRWLSR